MQSLCVPSLDSDRVGIAYLVEVLFSGEMYQWVIAGTSGFFKVF